MYKTKSSTINRKLTRKQEDIVNVSRDTFHTDASKALIKISFAIFIQFYSNPDDLLVTGMLNLAEIGSGLSFIHGTLRVALHV